MTFWNRHKPEEPETALAPVDAMSIEDAEERTADVDLSPTEAELVMLRRNNRLLAERIEQIQKQLDTVSSEFAQAATTMESLGTQLAREREHPPNCPHCHQALGYIKVEFPKFMYHPSKRPRVVKTQEAMDALGLDWRESPWVQESVERVMIAERNAVIQEAETRFDEAARDKAGIRVQDRLDSKRDHQKRLTEQIVGPKRLTE